MKFVVVFLSLLLAVSETAASSGRVVCYYAQWAYGYDGIGKFEVSDIDANLCTHVVYSFIGLSAEGEVMILDEDFDIGQNGLTDFSALRNKNSHLVTMVAVGGYGLQSYNFTIVAANETLRNTFASNVVAFLKKYNLLGLDVDWEYPNNGKGASTDDYENFIYFLQALKDAFTDKGYVLSAAVGATQSSIDLSYNVTAIDRIVDFMNIMAYDLHGTWDGVTGANAPLYAQPTDTAAVAASLTVNASVVTWLANGATPSKLNLGLGNYGHAYTLADAANNGTGAAITTAAYTAPYTADTSTWTYLEICSAQYNNSGDWRITNYKNSYVYAINNTLWIGYDNVDTVYTKAAFAKSKGLGGMSFWAIHGDDFRNYCRGGKWPLIRAAKNGYNSV